MGEDSISREINFFFCIVKITVTVRGQATSLPSEAYCAASAGGNSWEVVAGMQNRDGEVLK